MSWHEVIGGMNEEGWVREEVYEYAMQRNREIREKFMNDADPDEVEMVSLGWPFRDRGEFLSRGCFGWLYFYVQGLAVNVQYDAGRESMI
ncbi:hypothetical protein AJ79_00073 [Helicocarpus griseus UAMH5409]|uniref:Uncharacterized protein n=1 Tax=Helicocarpus griseus UAMH5409 TaxID=1447875 RepID=A0A2B7YD78_9EURO|nr:hypothetical protein AJ79_00073 [Helicocarpus griseus UAMH5409]